MPARSPAATAPPADAVAPSAWRSRTLALGLAGSLLCYLAHPPVGWSLLAWIGPTPWLLLARLERLPGRRPYRALWLAGAAYWLASIQWIRLPHWGNHFALFLLAGYLGVYLPAFVGLTRVAVHRLRVPLWIAGPVAWTGLEWVRSRLLTGFLMASLAHTQIEHPTLLQIADVLGEYGVTFLIMLVAACIAEAITPRVAALLAAPGSARGPAFTDKGDRSPEDDPRPEAGAENGAAPPNAGTGAWSAAKALGPAVVALAATIAYGRHRLAEGDRNLEKAPHVTVALIQSNMHATWKGSRERDREAMRQMTGLSRQAVAKARAAGDPVELVVWPETMFRIELHGAEGDYRPPRELFEGSLEAQFTAAVDYLHAMAEDLDAAVLVGLDRAYWRPPAAGAEPLVPGVPPFAVDEFNSSLCITRDGRQAGVYDKMHLLPFGEYIPLVSWLPLMSRFSPITGSALPGAGPVAMTVDGVRFAPNICYETVLPHLIRRQVVALAARGEAPDVLVNLTNDAWYWGSSELDMHLASGVFRAIEMRTPLVIAANRGLSAHVDSLGRVVDVSRRNVEAYVLADVRLPPRGDGPASPFVAYGDWFALACLAASAVPLLAGCRCRREDRK
jgi:apolipoprotein N-acyltransferase